MRPINNYNNILVFNPAYLGDTVLTTPLIRALRKLYPKAFITFCVRPEHAGLFKGLDILDKVIIYDKRNTASGVSGIFQFSSEVKSYDFDLVMDLHKSLRSSLVFALARRPYIVGFSSAVLSSLFNKRVDRDLSLHEAERNLMMLSALCSDFTLAEAKKLGGSLACHVDKDILYKSKEYYRLTGGDRRIVGIAPGSVWLTKRWLAEYFVATATSLRDKGYHIALIGSHGDKEALDEFKNMYKGPIYDYSMKTSISELPAFLAGLDLLITNDSGPMHVAIASGVPCVAIFGPTVKSLGFFPYDDRSLVAEIKNLDCRPCGKHGGAICPKGHFKCMKDLMPHTVLSLALEILEGNK